MDQLILTFHTVLVLSLLWLFVFVLRRKYCDDKFRNELFTLRDELFDYAASGKIDFGHPAYILLRLRMNGMIRYAHRASLMQIMVPYLLTRRTVDAAVEDYRERWQLAISQAEKAEVRLKIDDFQRRMGILLVRHLFRSSVIFFAPVHLLLLTSMVIKVATAELWSRLIKSVEYLEVEAERAGAL